MAVILPADLPTDWQAGQIIAPNGADTGLPEQYGYNYLMEAVNAAQQAINGMSGANIGGGTFQVYYNAPGGGA